MDSNEKKISIALLIALIGFPQISETIYTPALPSVAAGLHTTANLVEATLSIYFLGFAFGVLLWGAFSDYSGRKIAMLLGIILYGLGTFGCANVESVEFLLMWRFLQAFGASVGSVITQTILRDVYSGAKKTQIFSIMSGALAFSPAFGPFIGGFISDYFGWRANFWILLVLAIYIGIWTLTSLPETRPKNFSTLSFAKILGLFKEMITNKCLWGHVLLIGATNGILFGFYQEAPFIFIEHLGITSTSYGFLGLIIAAATLFAARFSCQKSSDFSAESIVQLGVRYVFIGSIFLALIVLTGIIQIKIFGLLSVSAILFLIFFGVGLIVPNSLSQALKAYQHVAGTASSLFGCGYYIVIAFSTWLLSVLHNGTLFPLPFYIMFLGLILIVGSRLTCVQISLAAKFSKN